MSKVYKLQEALRIRLTTSVVITGATATKIKYRKPDGTEGSWNAEPEDETNGIIYYDIKKTANGADIDQSGNWKFWAYITFADDRSAAGEAISQYIYVEGN